MAIKKNSLVTKTRGTIPFKIKQLIKHFWQYDFLRFIFIGVINTVFSFSVYTILVLLGLDYKMAVLLATILGVMFNFKTIGTFVFTSYSNLLIYKFVLIYVVIYFLNIALIKLFLNFGLNKVFAGAVAVPFVALTSFFLNKFLVFRKLRK